jgi:hypothetical protein
LVTSLKDQAGLASVNERQRTCALFLITDFIRFVVVDVSFLALNHFYAQKYEEGGGTFAVLPQLKNFSRWIRVATAKLQRSTKIQTSKAKLGL